MARIKYDKEFKATLVELVKSGKSTAELSKEYNIADGTIRRWVREYTAETGAFKDEATLAFEQEIKKLKKQIKNIEEERDILKKAVSIFSKSGKWDTSLYYKTQLIILSRRWVNLWELAPIAIIVG